MGFGDLKTDGGLQGLNDFLADKSYVDGWVPSQADVAVFEAMGNAPGGKFINALRWFNQINSYSSDERLTWPGVMKPVGEYGPSGSGTSKPGAKDDDDDFDLFGSDESEDEAEAERVKQQRLSEYAEKKSKKKVIIAKSNIILDVKPWDDETDMGVIEAKVRTIEADGLLWGASKLVPLAYGIKKLQISCVVEDDKIGTDFLEESITAFEDLVQSVDIAAFNKV